MFSAAAGLYPAVGLATGVLIAFAAVGIATHPRRIAGA